MLYADTKVLSGKMEDIAKQVAYMGINVCQQIFKQKASLGETFPLYSLDMDLLKDKVASAVKPIGYHHQVLFETADKAGKQALAYAVSDFSESDGAWEVVKFSKSSLAAEIDNAITFIDEEDKGKSLKLEVRLLQIPILQLYAFWLLKNVGTETQPEMETAKLSLINHCFYDRKIDYNNYWDEKGFIAALKELPYIIGVQYSKDKAYK